MDIHHTDTKKWTSFKEKLVKNKDLGWCWSHAWKFSLLGGAWRRSYSRSCEVRTSCVQPGMFSVFSSLRTALPLVQKSEWGQFPPKWPAQSIHGLLRTFYLSKEVERAPAVIRQIVSHSHLGAVQHCWAAVIVWSEHLHGAAAALGFITTAVEGCREEGGVAHSLSGRSLQAAAVLSGWDDTLGNGNFKSSVTIVAVIRAAYTAGGGGQFIGANYALQMKWTLKPSQCFPFVTCWNVSADFSRRASSESPQRVG